MDTQREWRVQYVQIGEKRAALGQEWRGCRVFAGNIENAHSKRCRRLGLIVCAAIAFFVAHTTAALAQTGSLSGYVLRHADAMPLASAGVYLYQGKDPNIADDDAWDWVGSVSTDPNGFYRFSGLQERRYHVNFDDQEVSGTYYMEADLYNVQVLSGAETANMDMRVRQAGLIYGYVRTPTGAPIPFAPVVAQGPWTQHGADSHYASTDQTGRYELHLAPSPGEFYPVRVGGASLDGTDYASAWDGNSYQATLAGTAVPDYVLQPGGTVTGRVTNESDTGIQGVLLFAESGSSSGGGRIRVHAGTDANGYFELRGVVPGTNYVCLGGNEEIEQDGVKYAVGETFVGPVSVPSGGAIDVGTFVFYQAGMITGIVTDETGRPILGAEVDFEGRDLNGDDTDRDDVTDAFGQYAVDYVAPGTYRLVCRRDGFVPTFLHGITVGRGQHVDCDLVLKSAADGAIVRGKIANYATIRPTDSHGVPLPYYEENHYHNFGRPYFGILAFSMDRAWTTSDFLDPDRRFIGYKSPEQIEDGYGDYFESDVNEVPGRYEDFFLLSGDIALCMFYGEAERAGNVDSYILMDWKRLNLSRGDIRADVDFTCVVPTNPGTLKGNLNVPSSYTNFSCDWAMIYAYRLDPNGNIVNPMPLGDAQTESGYTRMYEFPYLPAGTYTLRAYARNLASVVVDSVTVTAGQTTTRDITFTAGGVVTGQITDSLGPVVGAIVTIVETGAETTTNASGHYSIPGLNAGTYTLQVSASGHADAQATFSITDGSTTTQNFMLATNVGSISGTVKDPNGANINAVTVLAYNETDRASKSAETVGGAFTIEPLTPGSYIMAVNTDDYGVVVYPEGAGRITLSANQDITDVPITVGTPAPPVFTVSSFARDAVPAVLSMEFYSDRNLAAAPTVAVADGNGVLGSLTSNNALNRFEIDYTANANDNMVRIQIAETTPLVGSPASKTFTFEVGSNLVATSSTNVTNATGGSASIMGTQDNTQVYVPPFAIAGAQGDSQALTLTVERYGDPGDAVDGTDANSVSAVYDFSFDDGGVSIDENHTFTITMSFQLPQGMTQQEFESSLVVRYFDAGDQQWKTDGISNVRINWANSTIIFEVSHLSEFAAFIGDGIIGDFCGASFGPPDGYVDVWDLMEFADHWHIRTGEGNWDAKYDLTGPSFEDLDGYVDVWDLMVFADHWHEGLPATP